MTGRPIIKQLPFLKESMYILCLITPVILLISNTGIFSNLPNKVFAAEVPASTLLNQSVEVPGSTLLNQSAEVPASTLLNQSDSKRSDSTEQSSIALRVNITVAIGLGITSNSGHKRAIHYKYNHLQQMPLFSQLLPTFCSTASKGYIYHFYFAYDFNDKFFANSYYLKLWKDKFQYVIKWRCKHLGDIGLHMIKCNYSGRPAWAQNDAMMAAYRDGRDYFYRVNDDTLMKTSNWTKVFINELQKMTPPFVGVVGPNHRGGNTAILTYDFVHRTHIDIFGYYYPREFPWWYADRWITDVYKPGRSKKLKSVRLDHIASVTRYHMQVNSKEYVSSIVENCTKILQSYLRKSNAEIMNNGHVINGTTISRIK